MTERSKLERAIQEWQGWWGMSRLEKASKWLKVSRLMEEASHRAFLNDAMPFPEETKPPAWTFEGGVWVRLHGCTYHAQVSLREETGEILCMDLRGGKWQTMDCVKQLRGTMRSLHQYPLIGRTFEIHSPSLKGTFVVSEDLKDGGHEIVSSGPWTISVTTFVDHQLFKNSTEIVTVGKDDRVVCPKCSGTGKVFSDFQNRDVPCWDCGGKP